MTPSRPMIVPQSPVVRTHLLLWYVTAILFALAGSAFTTTRAQARPVTEHVYDAACQPCNVVATTGRSHGYDAEAGRDDVYDNVTHSCTGVVDAHAATDCRKAAKGGGRVNKVQPVEGAGPHTGFKRDPETGKITGYTEFDATGNPVKRFRGEGGSHGGVDPPLVLEPKPGKGPGSPPNRGRPARPDEIPGGGQ